MNSINKDDLFDKSVIEIISQTNQISDIMNNLNKSKQKPSSKPKYKKANKKIESIDIESKQEENNEIEVSLECIVDNNKIDIEADGKDKKNNLEQKTIIDTYPRTKNKIGIYHFDSMSHDNSEYMKICKVFKHIINYLLIKELNKRLEYSQIVYEKDEIVQYTRARRTGKGDDSDVDLSKNESEENFSLGSQEVSNKKGNI